MSTVGAVLEANRAVRFDLGCGRNKQHGFIGVDMVALEGVDIVCDLESYPWPFPDECASTVMASHLLEQIDPKRHGMLRFMDEVWRITRPDGRFLAVTWYPGTRPFYADPCFINPINEVTWCYFDPLDDRTGGAAYKVYRPRPWRIEHLVWNEAGTLEVSLVKRREDVSYDEP